MVINKFRIFNAEFQSTFAVVTSYLTGKPATNFMGVKIRGDNIVMQLVNNSGKRKMELDQILSGMKMGYFGSQRGDAWWDLLELQRSSLFARSVDGFLLDFMQEKIFANIFGLSRNQEERWANSVQVLNEIKKDDVRRGVAFSY